LSNVSLKTPLIPVAHILDSISFGQFNVIADSHSQQGWDTGTVGVSLVQ